MRWEIVKAKKALMSKIVVDLKEPKDVFCTVKWANDKPDRCIPLLQRPDQTKTTCTAESVALLRETHTKEHTEKEWHFHEPNPEANEWSPLTSEEVKAALWKPANTAPGADRITNEVWKRAWQPLGSMITKLYNLCLESGIHPSIFKKADLVATPKPGRPCNEP
ncbi:RNA-directed DNA polymerase from mobile element jockey [Ceratocystis lukuohia]|uniref:RNA-directed DNA polymerase from mobile element jockey n=1 Tax=Ceratocystis lukuohia TaxID=2019550 RepID=A0ABR4M8I6_9PEZI